MQHREDIWGEDSEAFRPKRWEGRKAGMEFVPISPGGGGGGGGPSKCVGREFLPPLFPPVLHGICGAGGLEVRGKSCGWLDWIRQNNSL